MRCLLTIRNHRHRPHRNLTGHGAKQSHSVSVSHTLCQGTLKLTQLKVNGDTSAIIAPLLSNDMLGLVGAGLFYWASRLMRCLT
jgi:hypothetical protein